MIPVEDAMVGAAKRDSSSPVMRNNSLPPNFEATARRITRTLFAAQSLGSAATVAIFPIVAIAGAKLSGQSSWAGVPAAAYLLGQAVFAPGWGFAMDRLGRRNALTLGAALGSAGGVLAAAAILVRSFVLFLIGSAIIGAAVSAIQLSRFVAAEVQPPAQRARAISTVVLGGTVGAIVGPLLGGPMATFARNLGFDELAGPYGITVALFFIGAVVIFALLRPEPKDLGRAIAASHQTTATDTGQTRTILQILHERPAQVAIAAMVFGQLVMTMLMVITPLHMRGHNHPITSISYVISAHVVGMYAFSIISGRLADRWGRGPVIMTGGGVLILACAAAMLSPEVLPLSAALFLLGLGWNFCYVGGSTLLADQLSPTERARTQGFNDLLIGLASATGSLGSGIVFAGIGFAAMGVVAGIVALIPLSLTAWWQARRSAIAVAG